MQTQTCDADFCALSAIADIQGYTPSQLNYIPPAAALSGAASDIGAELGPDPKLVNSVDRCVCKSADTLLPLVLTPVASCLQVAERSSVE